MSDLTFNKVAGAVLATGLAIFGLRELSSGIFSDEKVEKPGYVVEVAADTGGGAAAVADVPPDWGTVLPKADVAAGEAVFAKCQSCHSLTANGTGPDLTGVVGRKPGSEAGFSYSPAMEAFAAKQPIWDYEHIYEFVKNPQAYISGTKMTFVGLKKPEDRINVIAFLHTKGSTLPIPAPKPAAVAVAPAAGKAAAPAAGKAQAPAAGAAQAVAAK
jgi:cytochrome c